MDVRLPNRTPERPRCAGSKRRARLRSDQPHDPMSPRFGVTNGRPDEGQSTGRAPRRGFLAGEQPTRASSDPPAGRFGRIARRRNPGSSRTLWPGVTGRSTKKSQGWKILISSFVRPSPSFSSTTPRMALGARVLGLVDRLTGTDGGHMTVLLISCARASSVTPLEAPHLTRRRK